jgi:excinuclease UvrABC ATPase subunit
MEKPDVDYIEGLSPAVSIDQKGPSKNPRSTVGTVTEIYDYLRLLFARWGTRIAQTADGRSAPSPFSRSWMPCETFRKTPGFSSSLPWCRTVKASTRPSLKT